LVWISNVPNSNPATIPEPAKRIKDNPNINFCEKDELCIVVSRRTKILNFYSKIRSKKQFEDRERRAFL